MVGSFDIRQRDCNVRFSQNDVRFTPESGRSLPPTECPLSANSGYSQSRSMPGLVPQPRVRLSFVDSIENETHSNERYGGHVGDQGKRDKIENKEWHDAAIDDFEADAEYRLRHKDIDAERGVK
jgi:hypothetical protein